MAIDDERVLHGEVIAFEPGTKLAFDRPVFKDADFLQSYPKEFSDSAGTPDGMLWVVTVPDDGCVPPIYLP